MKRTPLLFLSIVCFFLFAFTTTFTEVCGIYYGEKEDYATELKLYDDSTFAYTARREFPFEVTQGNWTLKNDTVTLNSIACPNPEALTHVPVRTYLTFTDVKYVYKADRLAPVVRGKLQKGETLSREK
jgi:hypothetical protein